PSLVVLPQSVKARPPLFSHASSLFSGIVANEPPRRAEGASEIDAPRTIVPPERTSANDVDRVTLRSPVTPTAHELEPLSREEEHELPVAYARHGDERAADRLVKAHLRLVGKIAGEYRRSRANIDDLVQEGNLGLFMAVRKFDPERGVKLSTYAGWWIRAY